jgi:hypothetical protein
LRIAKICKSAIIQLDDKNLPDANTLVDTLLNVTHGKLTDGSAVTANSLGEHWWIFYPPEIVRQILEAGLNGTTQPTRYRPSAGILVKSKSMWDRQPSYFNFCLYISCLGMVF